MSSKKFQIKEVITSDSGNHTPILLNFANGVLSDDMVNSVEFFEAINKKTQEKVAVLATPNGNVYNGTVKTASSDDIVKNFIAIKNKKTNTVRLIQIDEALMINQIFNHSNIDDVDESTTKKSDPEVEKILAKKELVKKFSGKAGIRAFERNERMKINVDSVSAELNKTVERTAEILENQNETILNSEEQIEQSLKSIRPPINKDATKTEDVYLINDVIPKELMDRLNEECFAIIETDIEEIPIKYEFITDCIKKVKNSNDPHSEDNMNSLKMCIYLDALINLLSTKSRKMENINISGITDKVEKHIRENFCDPHLKNQLKTKFTTDKALCYSIVLAMLLSEGKEISATTLAKELSVPKPKLIKYSRIVNVISKYGNDSLRFALPGTIKISTTMTQKKRKTL